MNKNTKTIRKILILDYRVIINIIMLINAEYLKNILRNTDLMGLTIIQHKKSKIREYLLMNIQLI